MHRYVSKTMEDYNLPEPISSRVLQEINDWQTQNKIERLWKGESDLWTNKDEHQWMGWLQGSRLSAHCLLDIESFRQEILKEGYRHVALLGMGGSSAAPDLYSQAFGCINGHPSLKVLDSINPDVIKHFEENIDLSRTFFIVSSKSGTTMETLILKHYFFTRLQGLLKEYCVGSRFAAITDPGSPLAALARQDNFRKVFYGIPSVVGRVSALSTFGMLPLCLLGVDVQPFLSHLRSMEDCCASPDIHENTGALLGIILGVSALYGKDKVTLIISNRIKALGPWITQLLAESTGKNGKGIIPVAEEPFTQKPVYHQDRIFIYIRLSNMADEEHDQFVSFLQASNHMVICLHIPDIMHLGAELFRWQIATSVAGSIIGIHPFNQPDVESSKTRTRLLMHKYLTRKRIKPLSPIYSHGEIDLFTDAMNADAIHQLMDEEKALSAYLKAHLARAQPGDYFNLCAFIAAKSEYLEWLQKIRMEIREKKKLATTLDFGPGYLHSTGQIHKGGPNIGLFLQITADYNPDIIIPNHPCTFGKILAIQAQAEFETLTQNTRRFLRIHFKNNIHDSLRCLYEAILSL